MASLGIGMWCTVCCAQITLSEIGSSPVKQGIIAQSSMNGTLLMNRPTNHINAPSIKNQTVQTNAGVSQERADLMSVVSAWFIR